MFLLMPLLLEKYFTWSLFSTVVALTAWLMNFHYVIWSTIILYEGGTKKTFCASGVLKGEGDGANRKGDIGHLFGLANWKFFGKLYRIKGSLGKGRKGLGLTYFWIWFLMPLINLFFSLASLVNLIFCFKEYCLRKKKSPSLFFSNSKIIPDSYSFTENHQELQKMLPCYHWFQKSKPKQNNPQPLITI